MLSPKEWFSIGVGSILANINTGKIDDKKTFAGSSKWTATEIMEAYTNCREFNCVTPIMEQSEYHMFCRDRAELYLPEMYNKIGVGLVSSTSGREKFLCVRTQ